MRDIVYEQALFKHPCDMLAMLNDYSKQNPNQWTRHDLFAIQRVLQIYIESFIGTARYIVQQKYQLSVSQSREAIDQLKNHADLTIEQHKQLLKIIGFRNVLVHDYLDINDAIVQAIVIQKQYLLLEHIITQWREQLNQLSV
jgi:uncharacterized protein YutE (UPF0331/DUF86 family)